MVPDAPWPEVVNIYLQQYFYSLEIHVARIITEPELCIIVFSQQWNNSFLIYVHRICRVVHNVEVWGGLL